MKNTFKQDKNLDKVAREFKTEKTEDCKNNNIINNEIYKFTSNAST